VRTGRTSRAVGRDGYDAATGPQRSTCTPWEVYQPQGAIVLHARAITSTNHRQPAGQPRSGPCLHAFIVLSFLDAKGWGCAALASRHMYGHVRQLLDTPEQAVSCRHQQATLCSP
jgi:hypothetical protein